MLGVEITHNIYDDAVISRIWFSSDGEVIYIYVSTSRVIYPVKYYELSIKEKEFMKQTISDYGFELRNKPY